MLKLQGKNEKTRDAYARVIRRLRDHFDCSPDKITPKQFESYFAQLVGSHSWSTVKVDCWGIKFFWQFVLKKEWQWIKIVKPPKVKSLPDILTPSEIEQLIGKTRKLRYRVFLMDRGSAQKAMKVVVGECGIKKKSPSIAWSTRFMWISKRCDHGIGQNLTSISPTIHA